MEITKQTTMGEMLDYDRGIAYVLMQSGMHCVGCPSSIHESLEDACAVHGLDVESVGFPRALRFLFGRIKRCRKTPAGRFFMPFCRCWVYLIRALQQRH